MWKGAFWQIPGYETPYFRELRRLFPLLYKNVFYAFVLLLATLGLCSKTLDRNEWIKQTYYTCLCSKFCSVWNKCSIKVRAKRFHWREKEGFTGGICADMCKDIDYKKVISTPPSQPQSQTLISHTRVGILRITLFIWFCCWGSTKSSLTLNSRQMP